MKLRESEFWGNHFKLTVVLRELLTRGGGNLESPSGFDELEGLECSSASDSVAWDICE